MSLTEEQKKYVAYGGFGLLALYAIYWIYSNFFAGPTSAPPPAAVIVQSGPPAAASAGQRVVASPPGAVVKGTAAQKLGTTSALLDPSLHMDAMRVTESLVYTGAGRNIFAAPGEIVEAPKKIAVVKPIAPPRPVQVVAQGPPPAPPTCPPTCPPINLKFFGTSTSASGVRKAFLLQGDDVYLAGVGDVVQRKYKVQSISPNSISIEDLPNSNKQSLPLIPN